MPRFFSRFQFMLQGFLVLLIAVQVVLHGPMSETWERVEDGLAAKFSPLVAVLAVLGLLTLGLAVWRIVLRLMRGAPEIPEKDPKFLKPAMQLIFFGLYALLALIPVSGAVAWFGQTEEAARVHEAMAILVLVLAGPHLMSVLYQQSVSGSEAMARIKEPG